MLFEDFVVIVLSTIYTKYSVMSKWKKIFYNLFKKYIYIYI
jgi:hypothetical protein